MSLGKISCKANGYCLLLFQNGYCSFMCLLKAFLDRGGSNLSVLTTNTVKNVGFTGIVLKEIMQNATNQIDSFMYTNVKLYLSSREGALLNHQMFYPLSCNK